MRRLGHRAESLQAKKLQSNECSCVRGGDFTSLEPVSIYQPIITRIVEDRVHHQIHVDSSLQVGRGAIKVQVERNRHYPSSASKDPLEKELLLEYQSHEADQCECIKLNDSEEAGRDSK